MSDTATYSLRLPRSIKTAVEKTAKSEGTSMHQFVARQWRKSLPCSARPLILPSANRAPTLLRSGEFSNARAAWRLAKLMKSRNSSGRCVPIISRLSQKAD